MEWGQVLGQSSAIVGTALAVAAAGITWTANRRAQYDRVLAESAGLTTGEVARARHAVGRFMAAAPQRRVVPDDVIADVFTVLWTFERLDGLYASLAWRPAWLGLSRPQKLLLTAVRGAVTTWYGYVGAHYFSGDGGVSLSPSDTGVRHLHDQLQRLRVQPDDVLRS